MLPHTTHIQYSEFLMSVYRVLCTVFRVLCTVYRVLCIVYCVLCTVFCVLCTVSYIIQCCKSCCKLNFHHFFAKNYNCCIVIIIIISSSGWLSRTPSRWTRCPTRAAAPALRQESTRHHPDLTIKKHQSGLLEKCLTFTAGLPFYKR